MGSERCFVKYIIAKKTVFAVGVFVTLLISQAAHASVISFRFTASLDFSLEEFDAPGSFYNQSKAFETISGLIRYETDGTINFADPTVVFYENVASDILLDQFSTSSPNFDFDGLAVVNRAPSTGSDQFGNTSQAFSSANPGIFDRIGFNFFDNTGSAFSNTDIPTSLNLDDFTAGHIFISTTSVTSDESIPPLSGIRRYFITELEQIQAVPLPGAAFILLAGLSALGLSGGFRKKPRDLP